MQSQCFTAPTCIIIYSRLKSWVSHEMKRFQAAEEWNQRLIIMASNKVRGPISGSGSAEQLQRRTKILAFRRKRWATWLHRGAWATSSRKRSCATEKHYRWQLVIFLPLNAPQRRELGDVHHVCWPSTMTNTGDLFQRCQEKWCKGSINPWQSRTCRDIQSPLHERGQTAPT